QIEQIILGEQLRLQGPLPCGYISGKAAACQGSASQSGILSAYAAEKGFHYTVVYYSDISDLLDDLRAHSKIEIAVTSNMRVAHDEMILDEFDRTDYYAIVKKGNEELLAQLNQAIGQLDAYSPDWRSDLFRKYYSNLDSEVISFSPEERKYLAHLQESGTVIRAVMNPELKPYSYFEDGQARGIAPKVFAEVADRLGIQYEILYSKDRGEYKEQLQSGLVDLDLTAYQDFGIAQQYNLKETDPYLSSCLAIVTRSGARLNTENYKVATVADPTEYAGYNSELLDQNQRVEYATLQEGVDAVKKGECDAAFFYAYSAEQIVSEDYTHRLQYTIMPEYTFGLTIGVENQRDHRLLSVLSKGVNSLTDSFVQSVTLEELTDHEENITLGTFVYSHPVLAVAGAIILVGLLSVALLFAVSYRNQRQTALTNRKLNRFIGYLCENYDLVTEMNLKDRIRTDYHVANGELVEKSYPYVPLVREDYAKIAHEEDIDRILATSDEDRVGPMIDAGGQDYLEVQIKDRTGQFRWYSYRLRAIAKDAQHPRNYIMFKRDIQASKDEAARQQRNLEDALEAAKSASAAKGLFLSRMSHEIRTPLNAVIGYMEIAKDAQGDVGKITHCVENTSVAARHLLSIINDVLDISAIESGRMKIAREDFNLKDLITDTSTLFYHQAKEKGAEFEVLLHDITEEWVIGDRLRVNQILMNLLSNALKFTPAGGKITLQVDQKQKTQDKVFLQFKVEDTGIGMSEEFLSRMFQPFEQETAATAQKYGGTGLGLSITHNLVEMMGGSISVESRQQVGTVFTVTLHFGASARADEAARTADFSHARVLVVDDVQDEGTYIKTTLKRCGVKADAVTDGDLAIKRLKSRAATDYPYDLCILDWMMPGMDGVDVAKRIRGEFGPDMPIIIATAYDVMTLEEEAKAAGVNRVVAKPLFQSALNDLLMDTFGRQKQKEAAGVLPASDNLEGIRILLAEDNAMNMEIAVTVLQKAGAVIDQAVDGQQACDKFLAAPEGTYDLILMDIQMPVLDGFGATQQIRESGHPQAGSIPIVAMTANAFAEDVAAALSHGMNAHIAKPVNYEKLYELVHKYCRKD
ncbi:MAG: response regulator, partial [Oscillospiraceae bacterium]|nr:response regulator [Oscillospiraceae bacterium]